MFRKLPTLLLIGLCECLIQTDISYYQKDDLKNTYYVNTGDANVKLACNADYKDQLLSDVIADKKYNVKEIIWTKVTFNKVIFISQGELKVREGGEDSVAIKVDNGEVVVNSDGYTVEGSTLVIDEISDDLIGFHCEAHIEEVGVDGLIQFSGSDLLLYPISFPGDDKISSEDGQSFTSQNVPDNNVYEVGYAKQMATCYSAKAFPLPSVSFYTVDANGDEHTFSIESEFLGPGEAEKDESDDGSIIDVEQPLIFNSGITAEYHGRYFVCRVQYEKAVNGKREDHHVDTIWEDAPGEPHIIKVPHAVSEVQILVDGKEVSGTSTGVAQGQSVEISCASNGFSVDENMNKIANEITEPRTVEMNEDVTVSCSASNGLNAEGETIDAEILLISRYVKNVKISGAPMVIVGDEVKLTCSADVSPSDADNVQYYWKAKIFGDPQGSEIATKATFDHFGDVVCAASVGDITADSETMAFKVSGAKMTMAHPGEDHVLSCVSQSRGTAEGPLSFYHIIHGEGNAISVEAIDGTGANDHVLEYSAARGKNAASTRKMEKPSGGDYLCCTPNMKPVGSYASDEALAAATGQFCARADNLENLSQGSMMWIIIVIIVILLIVIIAVIWWIRSKKAQEEKGGDDEEGGQSGEDEKADNRQDTGADENTQLTTQNTA